MTERTSLADLAYRRIEELIATVRLAPGRLISEAELCELTGIGRTPIREALQRLARERLLAILPRRGIRISEIDVASQLRLLEVRRELERLIARSAARQASGAERERLRALADAMQRAADSGDAPAFMRLDRTFNELTSAAARNEHAASAMALLHGLSRRFWYVHYVPRDGLAPTARLHAEVARAIADGDEERAARASDRLVDYIETFARAAAPPAPAPRPPD